jgi:TatD DNase family protein
MTPKYIDIHAHVNFHAFNEDRAEVVARALKNDTWMINVGTQYDTSRSAVELADKYDEGVYAIVGLHPIHTGVSYHDSQELGQGGEGFTSRGEVFDKEKYREFFKNKKIVGIGECGLDYYRCDESSIAKQKEAFTAQIELANEVNKPLMLHIRNNNEDKTHNAYYDALDILKEKSKVKCHVHFFAGTIDEAKGFLDFGCTFSFNGAITFPPKKDGKGCDYEQIIKMIPMDRIITETDCPYLAPVPHRGKRNEPFYINEVVKKIAFIKGLEVDFVERSIVENAKKLFNI